MLTTSVVPRKGDVDRNIQLSMSSGPVNVVPRKGDVDRNVTVTVMVLDVSGRPPQGGRG